MPFFTSSSWKALLHGTWGVSSVVFLAAWYSTVWVNPCGHTRTWRCSQKILRTELEGTRPHVLLGNGYAWDKPEVGLLDPEPVRSLLVTLRRFLCSRVLKSSPFLFSSSYLSALGSLPLVTSLPLRPSRGLHRVLACIVEIKSGAQEASCLLV